MNGETQSWRILLVEDDEDDYVLTGRLLAEAKESRFILEWAPTYEQALQAVAAISPDAILVDYHLGIQNGLELVRELNLRHCRVPIILLTGRGSYAIDIEAMHAGAADYLVKDEVTSPLLERAIRYAIERKQTEDALRRAKGELELRIEERTQELQQTNVQLTEVNKQLARTNRELMAEISERKRAEQLNRQHTARIEALAEISRLLEEAVPDYRRVLDTIARRVAEMIGDACVVTLVSDDGQWLHTVSVHHPDPERAAFIRDTLVAGTHPIDEGLRSQVFRSGQPVLIPVVPQEQFRSVIKADLWSYLDEYSMHSILIVPLRVQGKVIGTLGVSRDKPGLPYVENDQIFLQDIATRAALAITNARLVQALQDELAERKRMEIELSEIQRRLIDSVEAQRLQLAQELHDGPMQDLYGLAYQLGSVQVQVPDRDGLETAASIQAKIQQVIQSLRHTAGELRPPSLAPFGLEKAIRSHAEHFQQAHPDLHIRLELDPDGQTLSERVRLALFRIYQVALINVVRHARAKQVSIRLTLDVESVVLEVQDDGLGFQVSKRWIELARQGHLGLVGAAERAEAVGGRLHVESQPKRGTLVRVVVPKR